MAYNLPWLSNSGASVNAAISAPRTSGPAPLAVTYDGISSTCTGMTAAEVFRKCWFTFEVQQSGSTVSGTYSTTGLARYSQSGGPVAGFNILTAGTYTVKLTATKGIPWAAPATGEAPYQFIVGDIVTYSGNTYTCATAHNQSASIVPGSHANWTLLQTGLDQDTDSITITVDDQDSSFSGTNTVCISTSGTFTGAPAGCTQLTQSTVVGSPASNTRYLYRRGESFTGTITVPMGVSNVVIGAYGSGARPIMDGVNSAQSSTLTTWPHTVIVQSIQVQAINCPNSIKRWTFYDVVIRTVSVSSSGLNIDSDTGVVWNTHSSPSSVYVSTENNIFECDVDKDTTAANIGISPTLYQGSLVATTVNRTYEHNVRCWGAWIGFIGHNSWSGINERDSIRHSLKLQSSGNYTPFDRFVSTTGNSWPGTYSGVGGQATAYVIIADNLSSTTSASGNFVISTGPENQDATTVQGLQDLISERNIVVGHGANWVNDQQDIAARATQRFNTYPPGTYSSNAISSGEYNQGSETGRQVMRDFWCGPYYGQAG